jgi:hypothetical protein
MEKINMRMEQKCVISITKNNEIGNKQGTNRHEWFPCLNSYLPLMFPFS